MSTYIDKNALINRLYIIKHPTMPIINGFQFISIDDAIKIVLERPDADVVERKKGKWERGYSFPDGEYVKCTVCGEIIKCIYPMHYCPNCGAEMESEK